MPLLSATDLRIGSQPALSAYALGASVWESSAESAGLPAGWVPEQTYAGGFSINSSQVIENWQINGGGLAVVNNSDVILRNCRIVGSPGDFYGIENNYGTLTLEHCEFTGSFSAAAFGGYNVTATFCEITGVPSDGIKLYNNNTITDCLIHEFNPSVGAHVDGIQMETDSGNISLLRNRIFLPGAGDPGIDDTTGCLFFVPQLASPYGTRAPGDILIEDNMFSGGAHSVHFSDGSISGVPTALTGLRVRNNVFVNNSAFGPVYPTAYTPDEWVGNVFQGTGLPVPAPNEA